MTRLQHREAKLLATKRSKALKRLLTAQGVPSTRLVAAGVGVSATPGVFVFLDKCADRRAAAIAATAPALPDPPPKKSDRDPRAVSRAPGAVARREGPTDPRLRSERVEVLRDASATEWRMNVPSALACRRRENLRLAESSGPRRYRWHREAAPADKVQEKRPKSSQYGRRDAAPVYVSPTRDFGATNPEVDSPRGIGDVLQDDANAAPAASLPPRNNHRGARGVAASTEYRRGARGVAASTE